MGKVYLVGAGPGDPQLITVKGKALLECAEAVLYDALVSPEILALAHPQAELIPVGKRRGQHSILQGEINSLLIAKAQQYTIVVRLKSGDPFIFGRGGEELEALQTAGIEVEVVPGITAGMGTGIPLTHRLVSSSVLLVTGHEAVDKGDAPVNWQAIAQSADTIVVYMGLHNLREITHQLMVGGLAPSTPIAVVRQATKPDQQAIIATIADICAKLSEREFLPPAILIIGKVVNLGLMGGGLEI
jgi:uroporphyrin-III C-methyltransferase